MSEQGAAQGLPSAPHPSSPLPPLPVSRPPSRGAGRSQLYPVFISHIVAAAKWIPFTQPGLPADSAPICLGLRDWVSGVPKGGCTSVGLEAPPWPHPHPCSAPPAVPVNLLPCQLFCPIQS